jgi:hypothetical protein
MRTPSYIAACVLTAAFAGCASRPAKWRPIDGAKVTPWEQTHAICDPVLQSGEAEVKVMAQYRSCMAKLGWTDRPPSRKEAEIQRARDEALRQEAEQLKAEIRQRRTKNALTLFVGVAPECQPGDPGTEICSWQWNWKSRTQAASAPIHMTCVLPKNGAPRDAESCRVDPGH